MNANVIYGATATYAIFFPYNLVKDTVAHTWAFTAYLQNLLKQPIGTLNGTSVNGVKVFITDFHATGGTGTVSVANADGIGTFTAPNQPYFNYNQIVAPSGYSGNKLWKFNVPNSVTAVSMSILISTDFPAEQNVSLVPPDTVATWVFADTNTGGRSVPTAIAVPYAKRTLKVVFQSSATLADRQLAIAYVNGSVVGGHLARDGVSGWYIVQVPDDGSGTGVLLARGLLRKQPQVKYVVVMTYMTGAELTPKDGHGFATWSLSPDSVSHADTAYNWNLAAVDAPYAWGCSTGSTQTKVGIVDYGFHGVPDLASNVSSNSAWLFSLPTDTAIDDHGTNTASVLAAVGNNGAGGITGAMWRASLVAGNVKLSDSATHHLRKDIPTAAIGQAIAKVASQGVRVINISLGTEWKTPGTQNPRLPGSLAEDDSLARDSFTDLMLGLRIGQNDFAVSTLPLLVIAAGNFEQPGAAGNTDAWWAVTPQLKDSVAGSVIVVGASDTSRNVASFSGANVGVHSYVDVMAPGERIVFLDNTLGLARNSGTSFSAPLVTAAAGLLMSFDSTIVAPAQLRQLILDGADSNTTPSGTVRRAGSYRFLSLYKPLVLAAKRKGAPLCRNRIWLDSTSVVVRRSTTLLDTIYTSNSVTSASLLVTYHGGNRVDVTAGNPVSNISLFYQNGVWSAQPRAPLTGYSESGASQSYSNVDAGILGHSHSGDSVANYRWVGPYDLFTGGTAQIFIQDSTGTGAGRTLTTLPHTGPFVLALAYSPRGDAVFAATGWSWGGYAPPEQITIEYWRVPLNGGPATLIWESSTRYLEAALTVSEDATELATDIESYLPGTIFGGYNCWTEYRSAISGVLLDSVTANRVSPHDLVCGWNRHSGGSARVVQGS